MTVVSAIRREPTWKRWLVKSGVSFVLMIFAAVKMPPPDQLTTPTSTTTTIKQGARQPEVQPSLSPPVPERLPSPPVTQGTVQQWQNLPIPLIAANVVQVIDGDTIKVSIYGRTETVRLIGVNTPETVHPTRGEEPYGRAASNYTKHKLEGRQIWLEKDVQERDRYGRLLAYVWLAPPLRIDDREIREKMFNAHLLLEGYAQIATIPPNVKYADYFYQYQMEARSRNKGLWSLGLTPYVPQPTYRTPSAGQPTFGTPPTGATNPMGSITATEIVFVTQEGRKYHRSGCRYLTRSSIPMSLWHAKASGYEPCRVCNPPH